VPVARLIGFEAKDIAAGRATVVLAAGPQRANPMGTLHGGIFCDIADAAMGIAFASTLAQQEFFTTVEMKINFFHPVWQARVAARSGLGVHSDRRGEPIGRESGIHVHGASRPEGIRPAVPLSFSSAHSAQPSCRPTGFSGAP
jgi:uncharacterized protein (TIGR00369 family)